MITGRVGDDLDLDAGLVAARQVGLTILCPMRANLGSLDCNNLFFVFLRMVNCAQNFTDHPKVINGFSELFAEVFGADHGVRARSEVGMGSLPSNMAVENEVIFELH